MFLLYRVARSRRTLAATRRFVEDGFLTVADAEEAAWGYGPGNYVVLSLSRVPGRRVVQTVRVPASAFEHSGA